MAGSKIPIKKICEHCGAEFTAQKVSTRFYSHTCASRAYKARKRVERVKKTEVETQRVIQEQPVAHLKDRPYLSVAETAALLGLTVQGVYKQIYSGRLRASKLSSRLTLIRREDIDWMLAERPYVKRLPTERTNITELYSSEEVCELFKISRSSLFAIGKRENIPKTYNRGRTYWSKKHIDAYFAQYAADPDITEWCTADEITERFGMTLSAVYNLVYDHNIPKKKEGNKTFYSKRHVQEAKGVIEKEEVKYYTVPEIMEKYNFTRDQVYHHLKQYKVSRVKKGRIVLVPQKELDQIFEPPMIIQ
ncbi:helix-turn-helix domain-containing protein [Porphyromonas levii]|uniref:DNA-binding protein n=1 Tax=Porphyromonas levii TaxID=28114 RepID=A0A4Y8WP96_9PORP|nr:helix-turn-helix domain-containing protein [Porphyromonas levii]TFH95235.1 DNA-binding protein [Porphyromonas levii]TFH95885.1 DNA-binding protein [Porphyromonas levii]